MINYVTDTSIEYQKVDKAKKLAEKLHKGQKRLSGEPFIIHPKKVAEYCEEIMQDTDLICAAWLHDTLEDTNATEEMILEEFGPEVAKLVKLMTKQYHLPEPLRESIMHAQIVREGIKDEKIIILKMMDLLHNLETIEHIPEFRRIRFKKVANDLYTPLLNYVDLKDFSERFKWAL